MSLKLINVTKRYDADRPPIIDNLSYEFPDTGIFLLTGASGIGKTTLLNIISGLDTDYQGEVEDGGYKHLEKVSYMFQTHILFPYRNAIKNAALAYGKRDYERASELLLRLGFKPEDLKKKPRSLSGGMQQRVCFARAVLKNSSILLLDEPTKELDPDTMQIMLQIINEESKHRLIIAATHDDIANKLDNAKIIHLT